MLKTELKMNRKKVLTQEEIQKIMENPDDIEFDTDDENLSSDEGEVDYVEIHNEISDSYSESDNDSNEVNVATTSTSNSTFVSKNNSQIWYKNEVARPQGRRTEINILREKSGPSRFANREVDSISSSFLIYFRKRLLEIIVKWTNAEGNRVFDKEWKPIDIIELKKFIGLLLLIGVYKSKNETVSELWSIKNGRQIFRDIMSRNRFTSILRVIRFDDAAERRKRRSTDKLEPIRECFELWNSYLQDPYIPNWSMTVDEQLVSFRGKCPFRQYMPSKPGKYGLKFWVICDSVTSYAWKLELYTGKNEVRESHQGENVVKRLTKEIENSGRNITCDNFFTSYALATHLTSKKLSLIGTIRKNKPELPAVFTNPKHRSVYSTLFGFQEKATIISYCPRKGRIVTLLSTMHNTYDIDNSLEKKPQIILDYNKTKGGVDTMDKMVRTYSVKRMTRRWPLIVFYNMIDISAMNAYIIWLSLNAECDPKMKKRRNFIIQLAEELVGEGGIAVSTSTSEQLYANSFEPPRKKSRCHICPSKKDRKTRTLCKKCTKNVCGEHSVVICTSCIE